MTEAEFQAQVKDLAELCGWRYTHFNTSMRMVRPTDGPARMVGDKDASGFPDLVLVRPPRIIFAELKTETGKLQQAQADYLTLLQAVAREAPGFMEVAIWRPSDWDTIMEVLR